MPVVTEEPKIDAAVRDLEKLGERIGLEPGSGSPRPPTGGRGGGGGGGGDSAPGRFGAFPLSKERLAMWLVLTAVTMLFAGLSSAYIVMRGAPWWQNVALPSLLWTNTFVLLASSVTIERTRRHIQNDRLSAGRLWIAVTAVLGVAFLIGQVVVWRQLVAAGVYLPSTLHSSFFYILTGLHGLHLLGGISALGYIWIQILRNRYTRRDHEPVALTAMYWHFMDGLWVYVFLLLILA